MEKDDGDALLSTPHQLLGMVDDDFAGLERRLMEALQHVHETGLIRPSDIQLPILSSPPTVTQSIPGYEGGELDPQTLGVACIGLPPSEGRGANKEGAAYNLNPAGKKLKTSQDGLLRKRMTARPNEGFDAPEFIGAWYKYFLEQPPVDFLVADPAANRPWPYVCFHMPKQTRVAAPEPATAVDETSTPADAPSTGPLAAGDVTGLVERLSLAGAASNSDGGAVAGEGKGGTLDRALAPTLGLHVSCAHCGKQKGALKQCARCLQVSYCGAGCQKVAWKGHKMTCVSLKDVFDKVGLA
ncbi:hypothetical protein T484DRAFT_3598050 [Baffinella frigidus]|nr:hypothetical protein T484DRAFT_3598050 [Cryptophyta sp. CCMP2293]